MFADLLGELQVNLNGPYIMQFQGPFMMVVNRNGGDKTAR